MIGISVLATKRAVRIYWWRMPTSLLIIKRESWFVPVVVHRHNDTTPPVNRIWMMILMIKKWKSQRKSVYKIRTYISRQNRIGQILQQLISEALSQGKYEMNRCFLSVYGWQDSCIFYYTVKSIWCPLCFVWCIGIQCVCYTDWIDTICDK